MISAPARYSAWDESKHKRGQPENKGEFGPGGGSTATAEPPKQVASPGHSERHKANQQRVKSVFLKSLAAVKDEAKKAQYSKAAAKVLNGMGPGALARIAEQVTAVNFHPDLQSLQIEAARLTNRPPEKCKGTRGFWKRGHGKGELHLDGAGEKIAGGTVDDAHAHIYAHEMAHAVDGQNLDFSSTDEWRAVYSAEIDHESNPLTKYARMKPSEGFAEFGRLVFTKPELAKTKFPKCYDFWKQRGLT